MNADLIAVAVLAGPAAVVAPAVAVAMYRTRRATADVLAALADHRANTTTPPGDGGEPLTAQDGDLAPVIPLHPRRHVTGVGDGLRELPTAGGAQGVR